jgi:coenzyme F420-0:L-glutamate ligase/coenzyme F420-1:gamma-L-glutamate ligase
MGYDGRLVMELMEAIRGRRSIRVFDERPVDQATIERLIDAATFAPSRFNFQPWHFHVATGDARTRVAEVMAMTTAYLDEYLDVLGPDGVEHAARFYADLGGAPVIIGISAKHVEDPTDWLDDTIAVGAALQNFLLAVAEEGLSACSLTAPHWIRDRLIEVFEIPEGSDIMALAIVGYADEAPAEKDRHTDVATFLK